MSFYLKSPRGLINLYKLEECVKQRLSIYENIQGDNTELSNFDCLIEDSGLDRTGHFIFRIQAYLDKIFRDIFIDRECKLLKVRLSYYDDVDLKYFTKKLLQHCNDLLKTDELEGHINDFILILVQVCMQMLQRDFINHVRCHPDTTNCDRFFIKIPFKVCPLLIRDRRLRLNNGLVEVPCTERRLLFFALYNRFLYLAVIEIKYSQSSLKILQDTRIKHVLKLIKEHYFSYDFKKVSMFKIQNIDNEAKFFPLCMQSLYRTLKKNNRLSHNARFAFSLFIKGIGATMGESMKFWESMYSKQHASCSRCTHSWQENEKKYIYGIRHMYGLEGARKNYSIKSCKHYQDKSLTATDEGGCPFKHFDDENLRRVLKNLLPSCDDEVEVMIYERKENPNKSCKLMHQSVYKHLKNKTLENDDIKFINPVQYFELMKQHFV